MAAGRGVGGSFLSAHISRSARVATASVFVFLMLSSGIGAAWFYATPSMGESKAVSTEVEPESLLEFAKSRWFHDQDADKLDDRMPYFHGRKSLMVSFTHSLEPWERDLITSLPGMQYIYEFKHIQPGAWIQFPLENIDDVAALDFVEYIELDVPYETQLDVSSRSVSARDGRNALLEDGSYEVGLRGTWRGNTGAFEGYPGTGVTIAVMDGGIDGTHSSLDDMDDEPSTNDPKIRARIAAWPYVYCSVQPAQPCPYTWSLDRTADGEAQQRTFPHAAAVAAVAAGTGDSFGAAGSDGSVGQANAYDRWIYQGVSPASRLVDVNVFVGFVHECNQMPTGETQCTGEVVPEEVDEQIGSDLRGPEGSRRGLEADAAAGRVAQPTGATIASQVDTIIEYNDVHAADPIRVVIIPLVAITDDACGRTIAEDTFTEAAIAELAPAGVLAVISAGNTEAGNPQRLCAPTLVRSAIVVGAYDDQGTIERGDDVIWSSSALPNAAQADQDDDDNNIAKPDIYAPGVMIRTAWTRDEGPKNEYLLLNGTSLAAAHVAGAAAILFGANLTDPDPNATLMTPYKVKEKLLKNAYHPWSGDPPYEDKLLNVDPDPEGDPDPDGLRDTDIWMGWRPDTGFGFLDVYAALCDDVTAAQVCWQAWERLGTESIRVFFDNNFVSTQPGDTVTFTGTVRMVDPFAELYWYDKAQNLTWHYGQPIPGVQVNFTFGLCCDINVLPNRTAVSGPDGRFSLSVPINPQQQLGLLNCYGWSVGLNGNDFRDPLPQPTNNAQSCFVSVRGTSKFTCEGISSAGSSSCIVDTPVTLHTFQNDPNIDVINTFIRLVDDRGDDTLTGGKNITVKWPGAVLDQQVQNLILTSSSGAGATATLRFNVSKTPGCFPLTMEFHPPADSFIDGAFHAVIICVSLATRVSNFQVVGVSEGTTFVNEGKPMTVLVKGKLISSAGTPVSNAKINYMVINKGSARALTSDTTAADGSFSELLDLRAAPSGSLNLYVDYGGQTDPNLSGDNAFILTPTSSQRFPFSIVVRPIIELPQKIVVHRGENTIINGTLVSPFNRGLGAQELTLLWEGVTAFTEKARTDRNGRFRIERVISEDEQLSDKVTFYATFTGGTDLAPTMAATPVEVWGRSSLELHPGQAERDQDAVITGILRDDTERPLTGQKVAILWGSDPIGNATTDTLGKFTITRPIPADERVGPVQIRADFAGYPFMEPSRDQGSFGVLAPTGLVVEQLQREVQGAVEIATRILDDQNRPISDQRTLDVFLAAARPEVRENVVYLSSLDLSNAVGPTARLRHGYDFNPAFGISDGARLAVSIDRGRTWQPVVPDAGYDQSHVAAFDGGPGWSGQTAGWFPVRFNLTTLTSPEAGGSASVDDVKFRLRMKTSPLSNAVALGVDSFRIRDGNTTLFSDDFETYGAKGTGDYWSFAGSPGARFVAGRETLSGDGLGVIGSNLDGTYAPNMNTVATSPTQVLRAGQRHYLMLRYWLDLGNSGDYVSVLLEDMVTKRASVLVPYREPQFASLPETDGDWRWLLYELPGGALDKSVRTHINFVSDAATPGKGFLLDEYCIIGGVQFDAATVLSAPDPARWQLTNFEQGVLENVNLYLASTDSSVNYVPVESTDVYALRDKESLDLPVPFLLTPFGVPVTNVTIYPEGIMALSAIQQHPTRLCRADAAKCDLSALNFGAPLLAPAWDIDFNGQNASIATQVVGDPGDREFVIEWRSVEAAGGTGKNSRFQVRLHELGDVVYQYGSMAFDDDCTVGSCSDFGSNALVGLVGAGGAGEVVVYNHDPAPLTDNTRVYLSHVSADFSEGCPGQPIERCDEIGALTPRIGSAYNNRLAGEAVYRNGFDLSNAGQAYLVVRQFVIVGREDQFLVQARAGETGLWRSLPALQGGDNDAQGGFRPDRPGRWTTAVYDLGSLAGALAQVRFAIAVDPGGIGQDIGAAVREVYVISAPRVFGPTSTDTFDNYFDTSRGGKTWWSSRIQGQPETSPPWIWDAHAGDVPGELGDRYLRLGNGKDNLASDTTYLLVTPPVKLLGRKYPVLEYWQNVQLPDTLDGLVLEASTDGGVTYRTIRPEGGGYRDFLGTLNSPGWTHRLFGLQTDTFDLTPYASKDVRIRLEFAAGATPFASRWILDDFLVYDRLRDNPVTGEPIKYLEEDGAFSNDRWGVAPGLWKKHDVARALEYGRPALESISQLTASGGRLVHKVPLPRGTPRGELVATVLFPGVEDTYGGAVWSSTLIVQQSTNVVGVTLHNNHDQRDYIVRNHTFIVEGVVQDRDGAPVIDGLVQVLLDGIVVGSARTTDTGLFTTASLFMPLTYPLGPHKLTVNYTGSPKEFLVSSEASRTITVKGLTSVIVERQTAKGDSFQVTLRALDDLGAPLVRTALDVRVNENEIHELATDAQGRASFTTRVPISQDTLVAYDVESLGTDVLIGRTLEAEAIVPAKDESNFPWLLVILGALLLIAAVTAYILVARRRKLIHLVEELAREIEAVEYALSTGDPVRQSIFDLYRGFLKSLERAGLRRPSSETPAEVERSLRASLPSAMGGPITTISELFQVARYSPYELSEDDRGRVQQSLQNVRQSLERRAGAPLAPPAAPAYGGKT